MRTTVDIPDALLKRLTPILRRQGCTFKEIIHHLLITYIQSQAHTSNFELKDRRPNKKGGMHTDFEGAGWEKVRDTIYK